ncbi:MAG: aminotransferase class I/II-fold pyridoxal phosphate-dependent enzyme [Caldilineaceae bacterium]|nr:aminotransferase class I/II-fold pyridoxal phosphate-dependent enzyme [Caldilineaceae bacterium]
MTTLRISQRAQRVEPFYVMELAKAAADMARQASAGSRPMIYLNIGEPDFTAPPLVQAAAERAIREGRTQYTPATGLPALREAISGWYASHFGLSIDPARIVVTAGASAALQLACLALIEAGDEVLMPDPSYPCNRQFVQAAEGRPVLIPSGPEERYQLSAEHVWTAWGPSTRGVLLASPSNPTGTSIARDELERIARFVREKGGVTLVDEIYLGLSYEEQFGHTALAIADDIISINSFSKYFNMTGWRLGWIVARRDLVQKATQLNEFIVSHAASMIQKAGEVALRQGEDEVAALLEQLQERRDFAAGAMASVARINLPKPEGAFYLFPQIDGVEDSFAFCLQLLKTERVSLAPGSAFGAGGEGSVRLCFASDMSVLEPALERFCRFVERY